MQKVQEERKNEVEHPFFYPIKFCRLFVLHVIMLVHGLFLWNERYSNAIQVSWIYSLATNPFESLELIHLNLVTC